jgi:predicted HTH domain antitoxin
MEMIAKAIETTGIVDAQHRLLLDESLPVAESTRVRVIVLVTKPETDKQNDDHATHDSSEPLTPAMRLATAILRYQRSEISQEKAAALAGLNRRDFLEALAREKRDVFMVDFNDLKEELAHG